MTVGASLRGPLGLKPVGTRRCSGTSGALRPLDRFALLAMTKRRHREEPAGRRGDPGAAAADSLIACRAALSSTGMKHPVVYMMASRRNGTLYVGVTSNIGRRAFEHRTGAIEGFTKRYGCKLLVWVEPHERIDKAIAREKQIKSGSRRNKLALIERDNPLWKDLFETLNG